MVILDRKEESLPGVTEQVQDTQEGGGADGPSWGRVVRVWRAGVPGGLHTGGDILGFPQDAETGLLVVETGG